MESLEKLNDFDYNINNYSDIDDYLKPTNICIQKDFVDSISNLSNLISNGLLFINYSIYENISNQKKNSNGTEYNVPKDCKVLSEVVTKGVRKDILKNYKKSLNENKNSHHKSIATNNNAINIIVTEADRDDEFIEDEDIFDIDQSMIKPHQDFNFADSSMLFDQSAIFDLQGDNVGNQSMIFMDTNERNMYAHEDPSKRSSMFLNINGLPKLHPITNIENAEGNNSTLVNLADMDNNYLSTSDNESNNSTAYWADDRIPGPVNDPEEFSSGEDDDHHHMDEFNQIKKKFSSLDSQDMKNLVYPRPNSRQKVMRNTYPTSSAIQVNQCQVFPDPWSEYDDINLAKATIMKQSFKNGFPHKKLYPVAENPNGENHSDSNTNSSFTNYSPYHKGFVNIYSNNDSNDIVNSSYSYIKDDLSITKDIVNKNVKKFNSMVLENEEEMLYQKGHPLNFPFSNISFISSSNESPDSTPTLEPSSSNNASTTISRTNASSPQPSVIYSTSLPNTENSIINTVNNFASIQSKFNQPLEDADEVITSSQSNHVWTYKAKEQQPILSQESNGLSDEMVDSQILPQVMNDPFSMNELASFSDNGSVIVPEKINIKDRISNIESSLLVDVNNNSKSETLNDQANIKSNINEITSVHDNSINNSIDTTVIKEDNNEDVLNESIGTVKDLVTGIESDIKKEEKENHNSSLLSYSVGKTGKSSELVIPMETEINENEENCEKEEYNEEQPLEFLSDHEEEKEIINDSSDEEEPIEFLLDNGENEQEYDTKQPLEVVENHNDDIEEQSISFKKDAEALINDNIIDGNLEDNIVIEEEDSIVGNAIEEALENKSFVIQENSFMDEAYSNDLSFSFDDHNAFHQAMKIFKDGSAPLEAIQEENENDNKEEEKDVINNDDNNANEEKIFKMIENNINEPEIESINEKEPEVIDSDLQVNAKELEEMICEPKAKNENNEMSKKKVKKITKTPLKLIKTTTTNTKSSKKVKATKKPVVEKPLNEKLTSTTKRNTQPKRVVKKISKSLDLPAKNLIPNPKVDNLIASNCVKAFTSSSLKQNIINTRPIEHEVAVSFSDFDKAVNSKPKSKPIKRIKKVSKSDAKTEINSMSELISKSITKSSISEKSISKPNPKFNSKTIKKAINETSKVSSSKVKPLTRSKIINSKPIQTKSRSEINKQLSTIKSNTKLANRKVADSKLKEQKKKSTIGKRTISYSQYHIFDDEYNHITYFPKVKRKTITQYPSDIQSKEKIYYQWVKELLPEYTHKFAKYELCEVMSRSYFFEAIIRKLSPEYESDDYNPKRNVFRSLLPLDNINKFNEVLEYVQKQMNITVVITSYDLHFGNLSSIFIIIKQLQRFEANHETFD